MDRRAPRPAAAPLLPLALAALPGVAVGLHLAGSAGAWWAAGGLALVAASATGPAARRVLVLAGFATLGVARGVDAAPPEPPGCGCMLWDVRVDGSPAAQGADAVPVTLLAGWSSVSSPAPAWRGAAPARLAVSAWPGAPPGRGARLTVRGRVRSGRGGSRLSVSRPHHLVVRQPGRVTTLDRLLAAVRSRVRRALVAAPSSRAHGLLLAVVLGDRSRLDPDLREAFARTGTAHLLAISGLHVGCCWGVVLLGARPALRRLPGPDRWRLDGGPDRVAHALGLATAGAYVVVAGAPVSARRAFVMLAVVAAAAWWRRSPSAWNALAGAALLVGWLDPPATAGLGLLLSVASVAGILALAGRPGGAWRIATGAILTSAAATAATAPLCAMAWGRVAIAGLWCNPVVIPLLGGVVVPLALGGAALSVIAPGLGEPLVGAAGGLADAGCSAIQWLAEPARAPELVWSPSPLAVGTLYVGVGLAWWLIAPTSIAREVR